MAMDQVTLSLCVEILDTFDDSKCGVEEHLANYIEGPASHVKVSGIGNRSKKKLNIYNNDVVLCC